MWRIQVNCTSLARYNEVHEFLYVQRPRQLVCLCVSHDFHIPVADFASLRHRDTSAALIRWPLDDQMVSRTKARSHKVVNGFFSTDMNENVINVAMFVEVIRDSLAKLGVPFLEMHN